MIRGWVQLINVSVLPRASPGCSFTRLSCGEPSQLQTGPGEQVSRTTRGGEGGVLDQTGARNPDTGIRSAGQGQDETLKYHQ